MSLKRWLENKGKEWIKHTLSVLCMSPVGKGGKLPPLLLPFLFLPCHSDSPSSGLESLSGLASSLPFFADLSSEGVPALLLLIDIPVKTASLQWHKWQKQRKTHKNGDKMLHNDKWKATTVVGWCTPLTHSGAKQSPITHCHQENLEGLTLYLWTMTFLKLIYSFFYLSCSIFLSTTLSSAAPFFLHRILMEFTSFPAQGALYTVSPSITPLLPCNGKPSPTDCSNCSVIWIGQKIFLMHSFISY